MPLSWKTIGALGLALAAFGVSAAGADEKPVPVEVAPVVADEGMEPVRAAGTLALKLEIPLSFKISGVVKGIYVDEGDPVTKGQILAQLIDTEVDSREQSAAAQAAQAESDLERAKILAARGVISEQALETAQTTAKQARAALDAAKFDSRFGRILAPADGVVLRRRAEPGELVNSGVSVLTVGDASAGFVFDVPLSDRQVVRLSPGDAGEVSFAVMRGRRVAATLVRLGAMADPMTGSFNAELSLQVTEAEMPLLRSGMIGTAVITPQAVPAPSGRLVIPADAIVEADGREAQVYRVTSGGTAEVRTVAVAEIRTGEVVISSGLSLGDRIVVSGAAYLRDGRSVDIVPKRRDVVVPLPVSVPAPAAE